ncbi:MAG: DUF3293 domain-containing protein [Betaproteobacteria bacterium]
MRADALLAAFRATTYRVETGEGVFDLRIGVINSAFDHYLQQRQISGWGVITAYNPGGVRKDAENRLQQAELQKLLQASGRIFMPANNVADDADWPVEPSFLVLGPTPEEMGEWAYRFSQLAFVFGTTGSEPTLVWV